MKKSLLIAPALGVLLLAAAGSVGGTVAWFSASSSWETEISSFAVTRLDGNLTCTPVARVATEVTDDVISVIENYTITDASFNIDSPTLYTDVGGKSNDFIDLGNEATAYTNKDTQRVGAVSPAGWFQRTYDTSKRVYFAVSWQLTFSYEFGADTTSMNLYFDVNTTDGSTASKTNADAAVDGNETYRGFRIAFIAPTAANSFVWAPNQTTANCQHVYGTSGKVYKGAVADHTAVTSKVTGDVYKNTTDNKWYTWNGSAWDSGVSVEPTDYNPRAYTSNTLIASDTTRGTASGNAINDGESSGYTDATSRIHPNYLGQLTPSAGAYSNSADFTVTCVAWFEGTDPNVVNRSSLDTVVASLKFFTHAPTA